MKYTVILLYPDDLATQYGEETYVDWVDEETAEAAAATAQEHAAGNNGYDEPDNFRTVAVFEGHLSVAYSEMANA